MYPVTPRIALTSCDNPHLPMHKMSKVYRLVAIEAWIHMQSILYFEINGAVQLEQHVKRLTVINGAELRLCSTLNHVHYVCSGYIQAFLKQSK